MRTHLTIAASTAVGMVIGGFAVKGLHAQAKPPDFQISIQDASDLAALNKEFVPLARLVASGEPTVIEGSRSRAAVL